MDAALRGVKDVPLRRRVDVRRVRDRIHDDGTASVGISYVKVDDIVTILGPMSGSGAG
ncbi:hypothetical protein [Streptomyces sp. NPDC059909]|uniref:hypothetical protein n=1 Tax=Streptomyces sp. NPDC059909 TaxID=3346998 RepID=UPI00364EA0F8